MTPDPRILASAQQFLAELEAISEIADLEDVIGYTVCCYDPATEARTHSGFFTEVVDAFVWAEKHSESLNTGYDPDDIPPWNQPWQVTVLPIFSTGEN